ncbi:MAG: two-component regulator propeller domain-containing protein [Bacteroidota bacterium]
MLLITLSQLEAQIDWDNPVFQLTSYDGLPSTYYKDFEEDEFGFLWVATYSGICRFDGMELKCLDDPALPEDGFSEIAYDAHRKVLWIGTFGGLYAYHLPTESI